MRRIGLLIMTAMLWQGGDLQAANHVDAAPPPALTLTFVTINIWSGLNYHGIFKMGECESAERRERRYQLLRQQLQDLRPDVIGLNEANLLPAYAERMAKDLDFDFVYSVGMSGIKLGSIGIPTNFKEGEVILARKGLGLEKVENVRLSAGNGWISNCCSFHFAESNQALIGKIRSAGEEIYIVNTHVHSSLSEREQWGERFRQAGKKEDEVTWRKSLQRRKEEARRLLEWMERNIPPKEKIVLMGDFNAAPDVSEIEAIRKAGFLDTFTVVNRAAPGYTWSPQNTNIDPNRCQVGGEPSTFYEQLRAEDRVLPRRIDYIFAKNVPTNRVRSSRVVFNEPGASLHPSDHFGVLAQLALP